MPLILGMSVYFGFLDLLARQTTAERRNIQDLHVLDEISRSLASYRDAVIDSGLDVRSATAQVDASLARAFISRKYEDKGIRTSFQKLNAFWSMARRHRTLEEANHLIEIEADALDGALTFMELSRDRDHAIPVLARIQLNDISTLRAQIHVVSIGLVTSLRYRPLTFKERVSAAAILTQVQTTIDGLADHYAEAGRIDFKILRMTTANVRSLHEAVDPLVAKIQNSVEFDRDGRENLRQAAAIVRNFNRADADLNTLYERTSTELDTVLAARQDDIRLIMIVAQIASVAVFGIGILILRWSTPRLRNQARKAALKEAERKELTDEQMKRARAEQALAATSAFRVAVMERAPVGIATIDVNGNIFDCNPYLKDFLGDINVNIVGEHHERFLAVLNNKEEALNFEREFIGHEGRRRWADITITRVYQDGALLALCMVRDVTGRKDIETRLHYEATHDNLTRLANRKLFRAELGAMLSRARASSETFAVLFIDLDLFKDVNDTYGHEAGDHVLIMAAARLKDAVTEDDLVARFGGDEFAVMISAPADLAKAEHVSEAIVRSLAEPIPWHDGMVNIGSSIGLAMAPDDAESAEDIMRYADTAMYSAKQRGRGRYIIFDPEMQKSAHQNAQLANDLQSALQDATQIHLVYQPIVDVERNAVYGFEALACWNHPVFGEIPRDAFMRIAEKSGTIRTLGRYVLRQACEQLQTLGERVPMVGNLSLSVNIAPSEFATPNFVESTIDVIQATNFDPARLYLEITENIMIVNGEQSKRIMSCLRDLGIRISIDDFGAEYSSLRYLQELHIDLLKIDRSFLQDRPDDESGRAVLRAIANLAASFALPAVAVGVDTSEQLTFVRGLGCRYAQGALWGKPMAINEIEDRLTDKRSPLPN